MSKTIVFEQIGFHSAIISLAAHVLLLMSVLYYEAYEESAKTAETLTGDQKKSETGKILIKLKGSEEKIDVKSPFVSSITRSHSGKLQETEKGLNVVGDLFEPLFQPNHPFQKQNNGGFDLSLPEKNSPLLKFSDEGRKAKERKMTKNRERTAQNGEKVFMSSRSGGVISEDSLTMKLNIDDNVRFSIGAKGDLWAKLYLSYVEAVKSSFIRFASQRFLMGTSEVVFDTEITSDGKIVFKGFVEKSSSQPALNYVGEKMIEYASPVRDIPKEIYYQIGKDVVPVRVRIAYSNETGFWWVGFQ